MTDYIKREDAYKAVADNNYSDSIMLARYDAILESIGNIKPADVRENVHGKWIKLDMHRGMEQYKCSSCGESCYVPECMGEPMYLFCPNCGAQMNGGNGK